MNVHVSGMPWSPYILLMLFFSTSGKLDEQEWRFLLTGGIALECKYPNPAPEWLTDKSWAELVRCSDLPAFNGLMEHFTEHVRIFLKIDSVDFATGPWN